ALASRGELPIALAPRAQTIAAFWNPAKSRASASTESVPNPIGSRGTGTGTPGSATLVAIDATLDAPDAAALVGVA
ncbi:hypothetical protein, partial [Aeromonas veronii]|uniref:hypothetical protein n=1 Tax=Aeromonas veronii TaxID=654 RepID=UPI00406C9386